MDRRSFLKQGVGSAAALTAGGALGQGCQSVSSSNAARLAKRRYGKSGDRLSLIGFGGIVVKDAEQADANRSVAEAYERGVNYFDVAPSYGDAEIKLGPALEPYRKDVFLACKTGERERAGAEMELKRSLERLRTDHFDLYQLHAITDVEKDVDAVFKKGGVMDLLIAAKKAGQIRHLGFSAHSPEAAIEALNRYEFDSVLFPINFVTYHKEQFGPLVIAKAQEAGASRLALKAMARQKWAKGDAKKKDYPNCWYEPLTDPAEAALGLRWTLSQPITAAIPPGHPGLFRMALDIASDFTPITEQENAKLTALAQGLDPIFEKA